jgi:ribonuclease E
MSNSKMLIDATHPEETRVVVQRNGRVEEFDFESAARKLLRGNIYLAKVTRVEPSLQAAFVDYGGNRHGFLAFNEIHPDYYQIPVADRQALLDEEAAAEAELEAAADRRAEQLARRSQRRGGGSSQHQEPQPYRQNDAGPGDDAAGDDGLSNIVDVEEDEHIEEVGGEEDAEAEETSPHTFSAAVATPSADAISEPAAAQDGEPAAHAGHGHGADQIEPEHEHDDHDDHEHHDHHHDGDEHDGHDHDHDDHAHDGHHGESAEGYHPHHAEPQPGGPAEGTEEAGMSNADAMEEMPSRPRRRPRSYKIQEVIKRRQVILVQVVKEERGNKGAALTTYLSLAGRYTVLMPNTARGGGISRKITNPQDRKRLKSIAQELEVPEGMGLIIRTAGAARTKQEIKRDFEYLLRLWESVRDLTLQSTAPSLVYEEGDLIKRSIRDLYNKDVEEVVVAGDAGYAEAHDFMRMLMPSHSKNVIEYKDPTPLFTKYGVERQLNAMFSPQVTLRSGGYIVINQTEALVAIDVNSGKSTREFSIEETALATNLEASDEIARQLKLRDLAGLIVIDFIDMEEKRNNRAVERRLKDALRHDRARIQLGRISHFGLMEMSRQRLRTGVLEGSTSQCPHCQGTGIIRSTESIALAVLRGIEDAITAGANAPLIATTTPAVALYILNSKRAYVTDMEARHGYAVTILGSDRVQGANFTVERGLAATPLARRPERAAVNMDWGFEGEDEADTLEAPEAAPIASNDDEEDTAPRDREEGGENGGRRRRRRRRRGRGRDRNDEGERQEFPPGSAGFGPESSELDDIEGPEGDEPIGDEGSISEIEPGEEAEGEAGDDREQEAEGGDDRGDKRGRRRRRGRRGGRRGREREGAPIEGSSTSADGAMTPDEPIPGLEPQPVFDMGGEPGHAQNENRAPANGVPPRHRRERAPRTERIWDVQQTPAPEAAPVRDEPAETHHHAPEPAVAPPAPVETPVPQPQPVSAEPPAPVAPARPRHETGSSEPRIERVVVKPDQSSEGASENAPAPQRKGWWQRRFGGE